MTCYNDNAARTYAHEQGLEALRDEAVWAYEAEIMAEGDKLAELLDNTTTAQWIRSVHLNEVQLTTPDEHQAYEIAYQIVVDYCERNFDDYIEQQRRLHNEY